MNSIGALLAFIIGGVLIFVGASPENGMLAIFGSVLWAGMGVIIGEQRKEKELQQKAEINKILHPEGYSLDPVQAEKIINDFQKIIKIGDASLLAKPRSHLPHSKIKIQLAFYIYIASLLKQNIINKKEEWDLINLYWIIHKYVDDKEAHEINKINQLLKEGKIKFDDEKFNKERVTYFNFANRAMTKDHLLEMEEYIKECRKQFENKVK